MHSSGCLQPDNSSKYFREKKIFSKQQNKITVHPHPQPELVFFFFCYCKKWQRPEGTRAFFPFPALFFFFCSLHLVSVYTACSHTSHYSCSQLKKGAWGKGIQLNLLEKLGKKSLFLWIRCKQRVLKACQPCSPLTVKLHMLRAMEAWERLLAFKCERDSIRLGF